MVNKVDVEGDAAEAPGQARPQGGGRGARGGLMMTHWKYIIAAVFLLSMVAQMFLATLLKLWGYINPEEFAPLFWKVLTIYAAPLGVILGGIYAAKQSRRKASGGQVWGALVLACIWNGMLLGRYLLITFRPEGDSLENLASFQDTVLPAGSFLTSAALAYLYGAHKS